MHSFFMVTSDYWILDELCLLRNTQNQPLTRLDKTGNPDNKRNLQSTIELKRKIQDREGHDKRWFCDFSAHLDGASIKRTNDPQGRMLEILKGIHKVTLNGHS